MPDLRLSHHRRLWQVASVVLCIAVSLATSSAPLSAEDKPDSDTASVPQEQPSAASSHPKTEAEMKPYKQTIPGTEVSYEMVVIPGGEFVMGSPEDEEGRNDDEGPQRKVRVEPFFMGKCEVTWDEYDIWSFDLDIKRREFEDIQPTPLDKLADAITRPTKPYTDMTFDMGHDGFPAICMTQLAAKMYCRWLSEKTGHYYRLPTEAEWEYACRAGTTTAYSWGDDPDQLDEYAWNEDNSDFEYKPIGQKKPNPWGLHDMHGNVAEWVLDQYDAEFYKSLAADEVTLNPLNVPTKEYPRVVRGGAWDRSTDQLRSSARDYSDPEWKIQDPQFPKSVWYHTDALHVGFRIIRPLRIPDAKEREALQLDPIVPKGIRLRKATR